MRSRTRRRFATTARRRRSFRNSSRRSGMGAASAARPCTTRPTTGGFHEIDFIERSVLGAIPGTGFVDWPITYADLEPYYTKVEWEVGVSGLAGASPFDPPRSKPYPMPPLPVKSSGVLFERGARKLGLHPIPAPMAINSQQYRGRPACVHCGFCHGFACEVRRKGVLADDRHPGGGSDGPVRGAVRKLRVPHRHQQRGTRDRRAVLRSRPAGAFSTRSRRGPVARTAPRRRGCC